MFILFGLVWEYSEMADLNAKGVEAVATIESYAPFESGKPLNRHTIHKHYISYNGYSSSLELHGECARGTRFYVLYDPQEPTHCRIGRKSDSAWQILTCFERPLDIYCAIGFVPLSAILGVFLMRRALRRNTPQKL